MAKILFIFLCSLLLSVSAPTSKPVAAANQPLTVGGFTLGTLIEDYDVAKHQNFVKEVVVYGIKGFRKGFITYGECDRPGEILRIKLKFKEPSFTFYEQLLERYKKNFKSKPKFIGGSFGKVKAWKWVFSSNEGQRITLVLQHNLKDEEESIGNTLKLSLPDQLIAERNCSNKNQSPAQEGIENQTQPLDWNLFLPK